MQLLAKVKIENIYKSKDYADKETGTVTPGKWKIQTFEEIESEEGTQMKLIDISIPDNLAKELQAKKGQEVTIPVGVYSTGKKVGFYGLER